MILPGNRLYAATPTTGNIRAFLKSRFGSKDRKYLNANDDLWFFFSGHGYQYGNQDYLMPADATPNAIEDTGLSIDWILRLLWNSGAGRIILFLDACREPYERSHSGLGIGTQEHQGVAIFYACQPKQRSYELKGLEQGAFACALLEGLETVATVDQLDQHLRNRVPQLIQKHSQMQDEQLPLLAVNPVDLQHYILMPDKATKAEAERLRLDAFRAEVKQDFGTAQQLWIRLFSLLVTPGDPEALEAGIDVFNGYRRSRNGKSWKNKRENKIEYKRKPRRILRGKSNH
jgi:uncharacterized caspase-like protein